MGLVNDFSDMLIQSQSSFPLRRSNMEELTSLLSLDTTSKQLGGFVVSLPSVPVIVGKNPAENNIVASLGQLIGPQQQTQSLDEPSLDWPLYKCLYSKPRSFAFDWKDFTEFTLYELQFEITPIEAALLIHTACLAGPQERYDATRILFFPCCQCGTGDQVDEIASALNAAWQDGGSLQKMLDAIPKIVEYPLVLAASLSAYLPENVHQELVSRLADVNAEMRNLHSKMRIREASINSESFKELYLVNTLEQAAVISMLEEVYSYTEHGGNVGGSTLTSFYDTAQCPRFVNTL